MIELSDLIGEAGMLFLKFSAMTLVFIFIVTLLDSWVDSKKGPPFKQSVKHFNDKSRNSEPYEKTHSSCR